MIFVSFSAIGPENGTLENASTIILTAVAALSSFATAGSKSFSAPFVLLGTNSNPSSVQAGP